VSGTMITLQFAATVEDWDNLPPDIRRRVDSGDLDLADWCRDRLSEVMFQAGQRFIDDNPRLFRVGLT
jgi:hypothetical protein